MFLILKLIYLMDFEVLAVAYTKFQLPTIYGPEQCTLNIKLSPKKKPMLVHIFL